MHASMRVMMDLPDSIEGSLNHPKTNVLSHRRTNVSDLLNTEGVTKVCAPMVRYSKLPFRSLVRKFKCDMCFTPMIMSDSFVQSAKARNNEFTTCDGDTPLIVQFASKNVDDFVNAAEIVAPFSDGVDLNCGCPQRWAMKEGYGAHLLTKPDLIRDIVLQVRNRVSEPYSVSVKLRLLDTTRRTVDLCRSLEAAGVTFLTLHARTVEERHSPIHVEELREVCQSLRVPLIANGDVKSLQGAEQLYAETGCQGVMAARGILSNPAIYAGYNKTPLSCVQDWINISQDLQTPFNCFHHHLVFMLEQTLPKSKRCSFNKLRSSSEVLDFIGSEFGLFYQKGGSGFSSAAFTCDEDDCSRPGSYFVTKVEESEAQDEVLADLGALYG